MIFSPLPPLSLFRACSLMRTPLASLVLPLYLLCSLQIADLYKKQQQIQNQGEKTDLEDYY